MQKVNGLVEQEEGLQNLYSAVRLRSAPPQTYKQNQQVEYSPDIRGSLGISEVLPHLTGQGPDTASLLPEDDEKAVVYLHELCAIVPGTRGPFWEALRVIRANGCRMVQFSIRKRLHRNGDGMIYGNEGIRHRHLKRSAFEWLRSKGGDPVYEPTLNGIRPDVFCQRLGIAVECGDTYSHHFELLDALHVNMLMLLPYDGNRSNANWLTAYLLIPAPAGAVQ